AAGRTRSGVRAARAAWRRLAFLSLGGLRLCGAFRLRGDTLLLDALGQDFLARAAVPFLVRLIGDLSFDEQLSEFAPLGFALERHVSRSFRRCDVRAARPARAADAAARRPRRVRRLRAR